MPDTFDPSTIAWVLTDETVGFLETAIATCSEVVMDMETTGLDEHAVRGGSTNGGYPARVALVSLTLPQENDPDPEKPTTWVVPLSHPDSPFSGRWREILKRILLAIQQAQVPISNQNLKFDLRWGYAHTGVDLSHQLNWDNQISSHLLDENRTARLKPRVMAEFEVDDWNEFDFSRPGEAERVNLIDLGVYAAHDTYWAWRQKNYHQDLMNLSDPQPPDSPEEIELARLGRVAAYVAMPTVATLTAIEQRGMQLDVDWTREHLEEHGALASELKWELATRYDSEPDLSSISFAPTSNWFRDWTEIAVEKGDLKITAMTDGGKPQWNKAVLLRQARQGSEVAEQLLEYRSHVKKVEYLSSWLHLVTPAGTIHCSYNAGRVVSGRLSSDSPNMQQVTAALKDAFIPREGYYIAEFDHAQIELRTGAFISRCEPMMKALREGKDLHRMLASAITGRPESAITAPERQAGKSANFGLLFLMGVYGFQQYAETVYGISLTTEEAALIHRTYFQTWDGIAQWHARTISRARNTGQVTSPIGRVRRVPDIWDRNDGVAGRAERQAINAPVQSLASDITMIGASSIEGTLPGSTPVEEARLTGSVHDSTVAEVPIGNWREVVYQCIDRMTNGVLATLKKMGCDFDVPLAVEVKIGTRWGRDDVGVVHSA